MKKLLLLLFLIPVLSWADYTPERSKSYDLKGVETTLPEHWYEYNKNEHIETHRCAALNQASPTCICENLGGVAAYNHKHNVFFCEAGGFPDGDLSLPMDYGQTPHFVEKPITPTPAPTTTPPKTSITDAKSQCSDIGFKKGTEKFGDCVLELIQ